MFERFTGGSASAEELAQGNGERGDEDQEAGGDGEEGVMHSNEIGKCPFLFRGVVRKLAM